MLSHHNNIAEQGDVADDMQYLTMKDDQGDISDPHLGTSVFPNVDDKPSLQSEQAQAMASTSARGEASISTKDFDVPKIADMGEKIAVQKQLAVDDNNPISLSAIGVGLLSLVTVLRVYLQRGLQPANVLDSNGGLVPDKPMRPASAPGDTILEMKSQDSNVSESVAMVEVPNADAMPPAETGTITRPIASGTENATSPFRRRQLAAAAAAAALPSKVALAAAPAPEVATDRKGIPIVKAAWEASHLAGAVDIVAGVGGEPTLLLSGEDGTLQDFALQAECTHLGCLVGPWNPLTQRFVCPCHGSEYRRDGSVERGPAPKPLKLAKVGTDDAGNVTLIKWTDPDFRNNA
jgi:cytochrome b6-f complex iron-sulfur subunit